MSVPIIENQITSKNPSPSGVTSRTPIIVPGYRFTEPRGKLIQGHIENSERPNFPSSFSSVAGLKNTGARDPFNRSHVFTVRGEKVPSASRQDLKLRTPTKITMSSSSGSICSSLPFSSKIPSESSSNSQPFGSSMSPIRN